MRMLQHQGFTITYITGWRAYLGTAQHNYPHWTRVTLPQGRQDLAKLESSPGVLPFEVYSQAPLRLISWCSFELPQAAKRLLRELAVMCEALKTTTQALVSHIAYAIHRYGRSKMQHNIWPHWRQSASRPEANCSTTQPWSNTSLAPYSCPWLFTS